MAHFLREQIEEGTAPKSPLPVPDIEHDRQAPELMKSMSDCAVSESRAHLPRVSDERPGEQPGDAAKVNDVERGNAPAESENAPDGAGHLAPTEEQGQEAAQQSGTAQPQQESLLPEPHVDVTKQKHYRPWELRRPWVTFLIAVEIGLIATAISLDLVSASRNGLATVPAIPGQAATESSDVRSLWSYGLLWTALPSFLMQTFNLLWNTGVAASARRQPYVDMLHSQRKRRKGGDRRKKTASEILLANYPEKPLAYRWVDIRRNFNTTVAALVLSGIASLLIEPLAAHLFYTAPSTTTSYPSVVAQSVFNDSGLSATDSLRPALDLANAIRLYGALPPAWMTADYAFMQFGLVKSAGSSIGGNVNFANASALSGSLDCRLLTSATANLDGNKYLTVSGVDRGCSVSVSLTVFNGTTFYSSTWNQPNCIGSTSGRLGIISGVYNASSPLFLSSLAFISCIPSYQQVQGALSLQVAAGSEPSALQTTFMSFGPSSQAAIVWGFHIFFESTLKSYNVFDPSGAQEVDVFGDSVLQYAQTLNPADPLDPPNMLNATQGMFQTLFAAVAFEYLLQPLSSGGSDADEARGAAVTLSTPVTRLYVTRPVAWTIVVVGCAVLAATVALYAYAAAHEAAQAESVHGLLGSAFVLDGSRDVAGFVEDVKRNCMAAEGEEKVEEHIEHWYNLNDPENAACWWEEEGEEGDGEPGQEERKPAVGRLRLNAPPRRGEVHLTFLEKIAWWTKRKQKKKATKTPKP